MTIRTHRASLARFLVVIRYKMTMKLFNLDLKQIFRTPSPSIMNFQVCQSVSHFNWFARYEDPNEVGDIINVNHDDCVSKG